MIYLRIFTQEEKEIIDKMYKDGDRLDDIRSFLHCKEDTLRTYLRNNGYERRKRNVVKGCEKLGASRKHHFNENYFDIIDTEDKAYWLGFLYADGNVSYGKDKNGERKGCTVELSLAEKDKDHLYKFMKCIDADNQYPLEKRIISLSNKKYIAYRLCLNSVKLGNDLEKHGCVPNKSLILKRPNIEEGLIRHFIRGYFDGDGCITIKSTGYSVVSFCCNSKVFLENLKLYLESKNIICRNVVCERNSLRKKPIYILYLSKRENQLKFQNFIYSDKEIYLTRKYNKFMKIPR